MKKQIWDIHTMEYYSAINEVLMYDNVDEPWK